MRCDDALDLEMCQARAWTYVQGLCDVKPNRRTGSAGNRDATALVADAFRAWGLEVDATPFPCLDHVRGKASLSLRGQAFEVATSPYSLGCDVKERLAVASSLAELESLDCRDHVLLMRGALCAEQMTPKGYPFYNVEHHQRLIALLEAVRPAAIITATGANPEQVGALCPFPLFVDGDFDIPSVYCNEATAERLAPWQGQRLRLVIDAHRVPSTASNVIARLNPGAWPKIVVTAHIDAYEDSPGASDNASGIVVLLLLAEILAGYRADTCLELAALNGEDHYSAAGQMDYLARYGGELGRVRLVVNVDDVGCRHGGTAYSFYGCPPDLEKLLREVLDGSPGLLSGEPWFSGDHMVFVQQGVPALAMTAEQMPELMRTVTHTSRDTPELLDPGKLVDVARALAAVVRVLSPAR